MTTCDLLVCGGGVAGVAAALEGARRGLRVTLVEKTLLFGGLATAGLVNIYLPLCDGRGRQVMFGIAEELLHLSLRYGPGDVPAWNEPAPEGKSQPRYQAPFSPASFVLALDKVLQDAGVTIHLDALACQPLMDGTRVAGVAIEDKDGRREIRAAVTVDATGDADIAHRAGAACAEGNNKLSIWALETSLAAARKAAESDKGMDLLCMRRLGADDAGRGAPEGHRSYPGISADNVTEFTLAGRRLLREFYERTQAETGRAGQYPLSLPVVPPFRMTRRIAGRDTVRPEDANREHPDSVALTGDWRRAGVLWEVPLGALLAVGAENLLAVGRCLSADGDAWSALRVIPPAAQTGQVAGLVAAMAVQSKRPTSAIPAADVQAELRRMGWPLHGSEVR